MTPQRRRAHDRLANVRMHAAGEAVNALAAAYEEIEYLRPALVAARRACDAKSGEARNVALEALFDVVAATRHLQVEMPSERVSDLAREVVKGSV